MDIHVEKYSDKAIKLSGTATKNIKDHLQQLGGKYNPKLKGGPGWIFPLKTINDLKLLFERLDPNLVQSLIAIESSAASYSPVPVSSSIVDNNLDQLEYQIITYKLVKPKIGMSLHLKIGSTSHSGSIINISIHNNIIDEALLQLNDIQTTYSLKIFNGQWIITDLNDPYELIFNP